MKHIILVFVLITTAIVGAQIPDLSLWNNIRTSAVTADNQRHLRCEMLDTMLWDSSISYTTPTGWETRSLQSLSGITYEAIIPAQTDTQYCRFRSGTDTLVVMMPAFVETNTFPPAQADLSFVNADSTGETWTAGNDDLDISETFFGYSDTRFYAGLKTVSGNCPTNSGGLFPAEYYFYVAGIINPENVLQDSVVYGMIYGNVPIVLTSGLYKFSGTEINFDAFERIGDIEAQQVGDMLILACDIDDLTNDENFGTWPNVSKTLGYDWVTASFALPSEFTLRDYGMPSGMVIDQFEIPAIPNTLPQISGEVSQGDIVVVSCSYLDAEGHFPLTAEVVVNGTDTYPLLPLSYDFSQSVTFETQLPNETGTYFHFVFSDNNIDFVTDDVNFVSAEIAPTVPPATISNYPNPFNPSTEIIFSLNADDAEDAKIEIFNTKGQMVKQLDADLSSRPGEVRGLVRLHSGEKRRVDISFTIPWDGTDTSGNALPSGIYFSRLTTGHNTLASGKMLLMK